MEKEEEEGECGGGEASRARTMEQMAWGKKKKKQKKKKTTACQVVKPLLFCGERSQDTTRGAATYLGQIAKVLVEAR